MSKHGMRGVAGFEDLYSVTDAGLVWSFARRGNPRGRWLKPSVDRGYLSVTLSKDDRRTTKRVYRLVADAFLPPPQEARCELNHIDGNKDNNSAANLEWVTHAENVRHAVAIGLTKPRYRLHCSLGGVTKPLVVWCRELGLDFQRARYSIVVRGIKPEVALVLPKYARERILKSIEPDRYDDAHDFARAA